MAEAGYADGFKTRITFKYNDNLLEIATILQSYLKEIGIELELNRLEGAAFVNMINDWEYGLILHTATYEPAVTTKFKGMYAKTVLEDSALALGKGCFSIPMIWMPLLRMLFSPSPLKTSRSTSEKHRSSFTINTCSGILCSL